MTSNLVSYLTDIPDDAAEWGAAKVLLVRKEVIHLKHIMTEVFVRKTIDLDKPLLTLGWSLFDYMTYLTNRMRRIHLVDRNWIEKPADVVQHENGSIMRDLAMVQGLRSQLVLDFDGVLTSAKFTELYLLLTERANVSVCSANPTVSEEWFLRKRLPAPSRIHAMRGKSKKLRRLAEVAKHKDFTFYVDNEPEYLDVAWLLGVRTYLYANGKIKNHSRCSK